MTYEQKIKRVKELDHAYFVEGKSLVADHEYDKLMSELEDIEARQGFAAQDSPTRSIGSDRCPQMFTAVRHDVPMQSLEKQFELDRLEQWLVSVDVDAHKMGWTMPVSWIVEPKVDGLALDLRYVDGQLTRAATRGTGIEGDDVTWQAKHLKGVPLELSRGLSVGPHPTILHVRGEVWMPTARLEVVNQVRFANKEPLLANTRNAASGALKSFDHLAIEERRLAFVPHGVGYLSPEFSQDPKQESQMLEWLRCLGFWPMAGVRGVGHGHQVCQTVVEVMDAVERFKFVRGQLPFGTDGIVIKLNDLALRQKFGQGTKCPNWAVAFKYAAEEVETKILGITIQVGRSGALTPVAELEPVEIAGTMVARASLHNESNIASLDVRIGDTVSVRKAGEIIPEVVRVVLEQRPTSTTPWFFPKTCPTCGSNAVRRTNIDGESGEKLYCSNPGCDGQVVQKLEHWCSKAAMDVQSVGPEMIATFHERLNVRAIHTLYQLTFNDLSRLPGVGLKRADGILAEIQASKSKGMARVLVGLGIEKIGSTYAGRLEKKFISIGALRTLTREECQKELGEVAGRCLYDGLKQHGDLLDVLLSLGVSMESTSYNPNPATGPLTGQVFVFTGTLHSMDRDKAGRVVETLGGKAGSSVSKKTTYLVAGEDSGATKTNKARELGVTVWEETEFLELLKRHEISV